jgi:hypothetical protein
MSHPIPVNLAVEDVLSEAVLRRLLDGCGGPWAVGTVFSRGGVGYLRRTIVGFNQAARGTPFVVLADLDRAECPPMVIAEWLPNGAHHNLILRFAVREVEAWVMADAPSFGQFLGITQTLIPGGVDQLADPKRELVHVANRSKRSDIVADAVPNERQYRRGRSKLQRATRAVRADGVESCHRSGQLGQSGPSYVGPSRLHTFLGLAWWSSRRRPCRRAQ